MTTQPSHAPRDAVQPYNYEQLLAERTRAGRRMMDAFCHQLLNAPAASDLWHELARLDTILAASDDYGEDFLSVVVASEQDRWHAPGDLPADQGTEPCTWCALRDTARTAVLLPRPTRQGR